MPNIKKDGTPTKRHRGIYTPENPNPYELSRSRIDNFLKCKALFWLEQVKGVKQPKLPGFTLNTTTDVLLKRDADRARGRPATGAVSMISCGHGHRAGASTRRARRAQAGAEARREGACRFRSGGERPGRARETEGHVGPSPCLCPSTTKPLPVPRLQS